MRYVPLRKVEETWNACQSIVCVNVRGESRAGCRSDRIERTERQKRTGETGPAAGHLSYLSVWQKLGQDALSYCPKPRAIRSGLEVPTGDGETHPAAVIALSTRPPPLGKTKACHSDLFVYTIFPIHRDLPRVQVKFSDEVLLMRVAETPPPGFSVS